MTNRNYSANAVATTLTAGINNSTTTVPVAATTGWPAAPFLIAIDYGAATQEVALVTAVAGLNLTVTRGYDSTTAQSHAIAAVVRPVHSAIDFRDSRTHENSSTGVHGVTGAVVGTTDAQALTGKDLSSGNTFPSSLTTNSGAQTLTNKTIALGSNTVSGTLAQLNTAVTDADVASLAGAETLTNKTVALGSNTVSGTTAQFNAANTDGDFATLAGTETLTNKTVNLGSNTLTGTTAQFNTALSDGDFATLAGTETLSNKTFNSTTFASPTITGVGAVTFVNKAADETVTSSVTLQDDNHLSFAVDSAGTYIVDLYLYANSAADAAGDLRVGFTFPTGTLILGVVGLDATLASGQSGTVNRTAGGVTSGSTFSLLGVSTGYTEVRIHGVLTATATGTLTLQWAQATTSSSGTTVKAGSHFIVRRVA